MFGPRLTSRRCAGNVWRVVSAFFLTVVYGGVALEAQSPTDNPRETDRFASRWVASRKLSPSIILSMATDADPVNRQLAMLQLAETDPPSSAQIDALLHGLGDPSESVRLQAAAGLVRLGNAALEPLIRSLNADTSIGNVTYHSKAYNGSLRVPLRFSDMAFTVLLHLPMADTQVLLQAYAARPPEPADSTSQREPYIFRSLRQPLNSYGDRLLGILSKGRIALTPGLIGALKSSDEPLAAIAARRIGGFGDEAGDAAAALADAVEGHTSQSVRDFAAFSLAEIGSRGDAQLRRLLNSPQPQTRMAALENFPLGRADAGRLIAAGIRDRNPSVRRAALARIESPTFTLYGPDAICGREDSPVSTFKNRGTAQTAQPFIDSLPVRLTTDLLSLLTDTDAGVRETVIGALANVACRHRDRAVVVANSITRTLSDAVTEVRLKAARTIYDLALHGIRPQASTLPVLLNAIDALPREQGVELVAVVAGIELPKRDLAFVAHKLIDTCATRLANCSDSVATALLGRSALADLVTTQLATRLLQRGTSDDAYSLLEALDSNRPAFRFAMEQILAKRSDLAKLAAIRLAEHGWASAQAIDVLAAAAAKFNGYAGSDGEAADALAKIGDDGVARLIAMLDAPQISSKTKANLIFYSLGNAPKPNPVIDSRILAAAAGGVDTQIQVNALQRLDRVADRPEDVKRALESAITSPDPQVRVAAVSAWLQTPLPASEAIKHALSDPDAQVRLAAVPLVARLIATDPDRLEAARRALADPDESVQEGALKTVWAMGVEVGDLLAAYIDDHEISPSALYRWDSRQSLTPALLAALERKSQTADPPLRRAIDYVLARSAALNVVRTWFQPRLDSADDAERANAARVLLDAKDDLWTGDGRLAAVLTDTEVSTRMSEWLGDALDDLYPPDSTLTSGAFGRTPEFPWPPPGGYSGIPVPRTLLSLGRQATLGDVYRTLTNALTSASKGFTEGLFTVPDGFALVARMERIDSDGTPLPGPARWTKEGSPTFSLTEFLGDLFFERPGYFRVIVFVVTNDRNPGSNPGAKLPFPEEGAIDIPPKLAEMPFADQELLALVYSFERRTGSEITLWKDGAPSAREHLERAGVWMAFNPR